MPGGLPRAAWLPSQRPWGADPKYNSQRWAGTLGFRIEIYVDFDVNVCSFGGRFGSSWGSVSVIFGRWSAKVGPKTVFEPSYLRESDISQNITFSNTLGSLGSHMARPKRPRSFQDVSLIRLSIFASISDRFRLRFGSFWGAAVELG